MHEPIEDYPDELEDDPIEDFSPHVEGPGQQESGNRAIEDWPQTACRPSPAPPFSRPNSRRRWTCRALRGVIV